MIKSMFTSNTIKIKLQSVILVVVSVFVVNYLCIKQAFATPACRAPQIGASEKLLKESGLDVKLKKIIKIDERSGCYGEFTLVYQVPKNYSNFNFEYQLLLDSADIKDSATTISSLIDNLDILLNKVESDDLSKFILTQIIEVKKGEIKAEGKLMHVDFIGSNGSELISNLFTGKIIRITVKNEDKIEIMEKVFPYLKTIEDLKEFKEISKKKDLVEISSVYSVKDTPNYITYDFKDNSRVSFELFSATSSNMYYSVGKYIEFMDGSKSLEFKEQNRYLLNEEDTAKIFNMINDIVPLAQLDNLIASQKVKPGFWGSFRNWFKGLFN